jgi:hypothetical protein
VDEHAREYATRRGIKLHGLVDTFEALALGLRKHGRSKRETDRAAMTLTLGHRLGLGGFEALEIAMGMFPEEVASA